ncbi:MAG: hypothetical protein MUF26_06035, partial [Syntrophales bacterium]|nr:hypothetical protein [Syntrophales bacterium]
LSLGDRRVGQMLSTVHRLEGNWSQALKAVSLNADFFVYRPKPCAEFLPWDFIATATDRSYLEQEYHRALKADIPMGLKNSPS